MAQDLKQILIENEVEGEFHPYGYLSRQADAITFYTKDEPDYSKRLNDHVTLYLSTANDEIVGCRIKNASQIFADLPNWLKVDGDGFDLWIVFYELTKSADRPDESEILDRLGETARKNRVLLEEVAD